MKMSTAERVERYRVYRHIESKWPETCETTLAIDGDVLDTAKAMPAQQDKSLGEIISDLARNR